MATMWKNVKLQDCCCSISDGDHQSPPKAESGIPFVTIANIDKSNHFDFSNTMFVPREYYDRLDSKRKPQPNDILYSVVGSFGIPVYIKNNRPFVFQRHIAILRPKEDVYAPFLYYTMLSRDFYMRADSVAIGAAQRTISLTALRDMEVKLPSFSEQRRIADVLSAYDDLIENNQKQIKLLEETAQRLYQEWFVDLHFPGYEHTPIVDGVPEGWKYGNITDISVCFDSKRIPLSSMQREKQKKIYPYYGAASLMDYVEDYIFDGVYVLLGEDGSVITPDGYPVLQYVWNKFWVNNHAHVFQGNGDYSTDFLYLLCQNMKVTDLVTGVAQPKISRGRLNKKRILVPSSSIVHEFTPIIQPIFECVRSLKQQTEHLSEARDRLLPKLMSGEIEV